MTSRSTYFLLGVILALSGCAAKQRPATNWRLSGTLLLPPLPPQGQSVLLRNARSVKKADPACNIAGREIQLSWRGRTAQVAIGRDVTAPAADVVMKGGPAPLVGTPVRDLDWWPRFTQDLERRAQSGCLAAREAKNLSARIIENLAMPSSVAYQLRYGNFLWTGYLDVEPAFVLSSVAPLLKPGVANYRTPDDVVGYETVYYAVEPRGDGGVKVALQSVERNMGGTIAQARRPATEVIALPDSARYVRYYFRMWSVAGNRKIALLATPTPALLGAVSGKFEADPEGFCKSVKPSEATCISVPSQMMIAPELRVSVNGKPTYIMAGGALGHALRASGISDQKRVVAEILPRLQVLRPYGGMMLPVEFDHASGDILGLIPIGGEEIRW